MATRAAPRARIDSERLFFSGFAAALLLLTFIGFAPTYFLRGYFEGARVVEMTPLVHLHGVTFTAWVVLLLGQTGLIAAGRADIHRIAGTAMAGLALALVMIGYVIAIESARLGNGPSDRHQPSFLVFPLANMLVFAGLCGAGIYFRRRAQVHKRLMLMATLTIVITPLARIWRMAFGAEPIHPPVGGMILADMLFAALVAYDLGTRGKLHPATLWGGAVFLLTQPLRVAVGKTEAWQSFARSLIG